jgi:hypothetical protein
MRTSKDYRHGHSKEESQSHREEKASCKEAGRQASS